MTGQCWAVHAGRLLCETQNPSTLLTHWQIDYIKLHTSYCGYETVKQRQNLEVSSRSTDPGRSGCHSEKKSKKWKKLTEAVVAKDGLPMYTVLPGRKYFS